MTRPAAHPAAAPTSRVRRSLRDVTWAMPPRLGHLRRMERLTRRDTGSVVVELVVLAPCLVLVLLLVIAVGRIAGANNTVDAAAYAAARAASISRSAPAARAAAYTAANSQLTQQGVSCSGLQVNIDTSQFSIPAGQPASVVADVTCPVPLSDLGLATLSGTRDVHGRAVSSIDTYRARQ